VRFYSTLFDAQPAVLKCNYAKWMLDDPRANFAITAGSTTAGPDHLGLQVESDEDLAIIAGRLDAAGHSVLKQGDAACCYARGSKGWTSDPSGISWRPFTPSARTRCTATTLLRVRQDPWALIHATRGPRLRPVPAAPLRKRSSAPKSRRMTRHGQS
jgi:hypothetical protein